MTRITAFVVGCAIVLLMGAGGAGATSDKLIQPMPHADACDVADACVSHCTDDRPVCVLVRTCGLLDWTAEGYPLCIVIVVDKGAKVIVRID